MRWRILDRSKILTSSWVIFSKFPNDFFWTRLFPHRPPQVVRIKSKLQKSPCWFDGFMCQHSESDMQDSARNLKYIDRLKLCRRLFWIRALILEWWLDVRINSIFVILYGRPDWYQRRSTRARWPTGLWLPSSPRPYLDGTTDRFEWEAHSLENGVQI